MILQIWSTLAVLLVTLTFTRANPPLHFDGLQETSPYIKNSGMGIFEAINPDYRLNGTFIPTHYDLELLVILDDDPTIGEQYTAPGKVTIDAKPTSITNQITLHSFLVKIDSQSVKVTNPAQPNQPIGVTGITNATDEGVQFLTISVDTTLDANQVYQIHIEFVAPISRDILNGLYLSTYTDPTTGTQKRLAATQMESIHARKLFPCFDEPELKATFDVTITRKNNYTALANGNLVSTTDDPTRPGWSVDKFNRTVPMSTYLFALVVSDFTYTEADASLFPGKVVKVYAQPHIIARGGGDYGVKTAAKLLQFYDDYFQAPYPLAKMDTVSIPQFGPGAMENYGLNLYTESLLVYFPNETSEASRNSITSVLAHELGHQNFGNFVTMNWWTQIWLNEGFATYVANLGVEAVNPEFRPREDLGQLQGSMVTDVSSISHPVQNNVPPTAVDSHVGSITYDKGGSINRMTENFLTEQTMQKGLRYYLQDMKYQAVHSDDLFRNLDRAAAEDNRLPTGITVKQILDSWTLQKGHPLVRVTINDENTVWITQEKYAHLDDSPTRLWYVPVTIVTQDKPTLVNNVPELWLTNNTEPTAYFHDVTKWIMINQNATGYYRVLYDEQLTSLIQKQLETNASVISPMSKSQLFDDYFTMAYRGNISIETALDLTKYLAQEDHFAVWSVVFNHLRKPYTIVGSDLISNQKIQAFLGLRVEAALSKVGVVQSPDHIGAAAIHRIRLLDWACSLGVSSGCRQYAEQLFTEWKLNPDVSPVPLELRSILHCAMVFYADGEDVLNFTFDRYVATSAGSSMKSVLLNSLACTPQTSQLAILLDAAVSPELGISPSDSLTLIQRVAMNSNYGGPLILKFLEEKLSEIISTIGGGVPNPIASIISTYSGYVHQQTDLDDLIGFVNENAAVLEPVNDSIQASFDKIRENISWMTTFGNDINSWFTNNSK